MIVLTPRHELPKRSYCTTDSRTFSKHLLNMLFETRYITDKGTSYTLQTEKQHTTTNCVESITGSCRRPMCTALPSKTTRMPTRTHAAGHMHTPKSEATPSCISTTDRCSPAATICNTSVNDLPLVGGEMECFCSRVPVVALPALP